MSILSKAYLIVSRIAQAEILTVTNKKQKSQESATIPVISAYFLNIGKIRSSAVELLIYAEGGDRRASEVLGNKVSVQSSLTCM